MKIRRKSEVLTTLPSSYETGPEKLAAARGEGILLQKVVELRNQLLKLAEAEKASIECPLWSLSRIRIASATSKDHALSDDVLAISWN